MNATGGPARIVARWAARRSVPAGALGGTAFTCCVCAAAWLSAGTRLSAIVGACALLAGHIVLRAGGELAETGAGDGASGAGSGRDGAVPGGGGVVRRAAGDRVAQARGRAGGWPPGPALAVAESVVCAGLAAGVPAAARGGAWALAAGVTGLLAIRATVTVCHGELRQATVAGSAGHAGPGQPAGRRWRGPASPVLRWVLGLPPGQWALLIAVAAPLWGGRAALAAAFGWSALAAGVAVARRPAGRVHAAAAVPSEAVLLAALAAPAVAGGGGAGAPATPAEPAGAGPAGGPPAGAVAGSGWPARRHSPGDWRGDGALAASVGRLLRGEVAPLPPALTGLAATLLLATLGLRGLPGIALLGPVAAMLLAMAGAGHPHDGGFDWLVPAVLHAGEYVYLGSLGFAAGVPGPLTFALICVVAAVHRQAPRRHQAPRAWGAAGWRVGAALGWEGRLLVAGGCAVFGFASLAYYALTAYFGLLLSRAGLSAWLSAGEGERW